MTHRSSPLARWFAFAIVAALGAACVAPPPDPDDPLDDDAGETAGRTSSMWELGRPLQLRDLVAVERRPIERADFTDRDERAVVDGGAATSPVLYDSTGEGLRRYHGLQPFLDAGLDGWDATGQVEMAFIDTGFNSDHLALSYWSNGARRSRVRGKWQCGGGAGCNPVDGDFYWDTQEHGSLILGSSVMGLTGGLDPTVPTAFERYYTYLAPDVRLYLIGDGIGGEVSPQNDMRAAMSKASALDALIVSQSQGAHDGERDYDGVVEREEFDCDGTGSGPYTQAADLLYRTGHAYFAPAGNENHLDAHCSLRDTAAAAGSFAVGSLNEDVYSLFSEAFISPGSSRGGIDMYVQLPGGGGALRTDARTGVDLTVVGSTRFAPGVDVDGVPSNSGPSSYVTYGGAATSLATPKAAAAAAVFAHWYERAFGTAPMPGQIYAAMLLFGDRYGEGGYRVRGFDRLYGAGRLKMPDLVGDPSIGFALDVVQVDDGLATTLPLLGPVGHGGRLPANAKDLKVVAWWFEPWAYDRGAGTYHASDIVLGIRSVASDNGCTGGHAGTVSAADLSYDVKKMVYSTDADLGGNCVVADLSGLAVSRSCAPKPGLPSLCPTRRTVYVAWMYRTE